VTLAGAPSRGLFSSHADTAVRRAIGDRLCARRGPVSSPPLGTWREVRCLRFRL